MWREKKRKKIYRKVHTKYVEFREKYKAVDRRFRKGGHMPALKEELRKRDEELLASVEQFNSFEGELKRKEEELELNRGVEAQCHDLQSHTYQLHGD